MSHSCATTHVDERGTLPPVLQPELAAFLAECAVDAPSDHQAQDERTDIMQHDGGAVRRSLRETKQIIPFTPPLPPPPTSRQVPATSRQVPTTAKRYDSPPAVKRMLLESNKAAVAATQKAEKEVEKLRAQLAAAKENAEEEKATRKQKEQEVWLPGYPTDVVLHARLAFFQ